MVDERVHFGANMLVFAAAVAVFVGLKLGGQTRICKFLLRELQIACWDLCGGLGSGFAVTTRRGEGGVYMHTIWFGTRLARVVPRVGRGRQRR